MTCTTVMMALSVSTALANQPAAGLNDQGRGRGRGAAQAAHMKFDDHDRQVTRTWYDAHQRSLPAGFRDRDRLSPSVELQFQEGFVLDRALRLQVHSVPSALLSLLFPAPRTYRYVVVGGHIVLIDSGYRVYDIIHVGHGR
jgi:hypothetical protein